MTERLELYGPWFKNIKNGKVCNNCRRPYIDDEDELGDAVGCGLCYECFEAGVEEYEIRKRERIARQNEY